VLIVDALGTRAGTVSQAKEFLEKWRKLQNGAQSALAAFGNRHDLPNPSPETLGDTLIFTWDTSGMRADDSDLCLRDAGLFAGYVVYKGFKEEIPLRGALSFGHYIKGPRIVLGPAISDAMAWHNEPIWTGVIATPRCGMRIARLHGQKQLAGDSDKPNIPWSFVEFDVLIKGRRGVMQREKFWTADWTMGYLPRRRREDRSDTRIQKQESRSELLEDLEAFRMPKGTEINYREALSYFDSVYGQNEPPAGVAYDVTVTREAKE
jgi:hypothetical protein